jgi:hypothetical protein
MKNYNLTIDWILITIFTMIIISKFTTLPFVKIIQPVFFIFIIIHIIQHRKIIIYSFKKKFRNKK